MNKLLIVFLLFVSCSMTDAQKEKAVHVAGVIIGMTVEAFISANGNPMQRFSARGGDSETLVYPDYTVMVRNGKVFSVSGTAEE